MTMIDWIRAKYEEHGRQWLHDNFQTMCMEVSLPPGKSSHNHESYMRQVRAVVSEHSGKVVADTSDKVRTVEDAVDFHEVDMTQFDIKKVKVNSWGSETNRNKQVTLFLDPKEQRVDIKELIEDFKAEVKDYRPTLIQHNYALETDPVMLEICLPDVHHGLMTYGPEAGHDYDIRISRERFLQTAQQMLAMASGYKLEKILLVLNGDFLNADNIQGHTTSGTPQTNDSRYQKWYSTGWKMIRDCVESCKQIAPVHLVITQGNHDMLLSYCLAETLQAWFADDENVTIDESIKYYRYVQYGECLIGITHGDGAKKLEQLPMIMAVDCPQEWAVTKHREFHIGHLHRSSTKVIAVSSEMEFTGVKVVVCPAISSASDWSVRMGFRSVPEAQGFLWHRDKGRIASFHYRPV